MECGGGHYHEHLNKIMATIITSTFADGAKQGIELANESLGRQFAIGSDWTKIRIGIHFNIVPDGTNSLTSTWLAIFGSSASTDHFGSQAMNLGVGSVFGATTTGYGGAGWTYNAGTGNPFYSIALFDGKMVNAVQAGSGGSPSSTFLPTDAGSTLRRGVLSVDLKKSGTNMQAHGCVSSSAINGTNGTLSDFRNFMADSNSAADGGTNPSYLGSATRDAFGYTHTTYTTDAGTYGEIDSVSIGYSEALLTQLRIYALEVYRLA